jgi:hypothetical protein
MSRADDLIARMLAEEEARLMDTEFTTYTNLPAYTSFPPPSMSELVRYWDEMKFQLTGPTRCVSCQCELHPWDSERVERSFPTPDGKETIFIMRQCFDREGCLRRAIERLVPIMLPVEFRW